MDWGGGRRTISHTQSCSQNRGDCYLGRVDLGGCIRFTLRSCVLFIVSNEKCDLEMTITTIRGKAYRLPRCLKGQNRQRFNTQHGGNLADESANITGGGGVGAKLGELSLD